MVYKVQEQTNPEGNNIMSIDLGLDNLATITYKDYSESHIINGKPLKSKNGYFNREISKLQIIRMKQVGSKNFKDTNQIKKLRLKLSCIIWYSLRSISTKKDSARTFSYYSHHYSLFCLRFSLCFFYSKFYIKEK
ncbi:transposase [Halanaerobaculum tunisiense]